MTGTFTPQHTRTFICAHCGNKVEIAYGIPRPNNCPKCNSSNIHRALEERGRGHGHGCRRP